MNPQEFVSKWRNADFKERSFYQTHFNDLCQLVGHPDPIEYGQKEVFSFEAAADRGFADVWKRGYFAWEYKGSRKNLEGAYDQLLRYREALQNPPLLIVSDAGLIRIHTNFTNTIKREYEITLDDLLEPEKLEILKAAFHNPQKLKAPETPEQVTEQAAKQFAQLAELLRKWGEDPAHTAHFLIRLLFCLFAEDIGLLPKDIFTRLVEQTRRNSQAFAGQLRQLFAAMATGGWFGTEQIVHFDGGLFDDDFVLELDSQGIDVLSSVSGLDWSSIEPSILGTLFERSLDPGKRAQLGAHYTSRDDILLIVEPVLMAPLRRRWTEVQTLARELAAARDEAATPRKRRNRATELQSLLDDFAAEIQAVRVLDPACGSGNFLYVALRQLLDLWKQVSALAGELGLTLMTTLSAPSPAQLYGIEINAYAHELAQATIWIGYIQWLRENGFGQPAPPILKQLDNIKRMDAILGYEEGSGGADEAGSRGARVPMEPEWPQAEVVIGNPPFLGDKKMRGELGDEYVDDLRAMYGDRIPGQSDLVCYWFEKARALLQEKKLNRAGLLATQGIRGGANRVVLDRIKETGDVFFAYSDRNWILDGATVHVSLVGFDSGSEIERELNGEKVRSINSNLSSLADITKAQKLAENRNLAFIGTQKGGAFDISHEQAQKMISKSGNPNGCPNSDVIRPWINGSDITQRSSGKWIIDFGGFMPMEKAAEYEMPFEYIREHVYPKRKNLKRKNHRVYWWIHGESRPGMRDALEGLNRYIATPRVSKHRIFVWQPMEVLADSAVVVIACSTDFFFGVLHSRIHEIWSRNTGTQLREAESGFRYSQTMTFATFPFPWPPGKEPGPPPPSLRDTSPKSEVFGGGWEGVQAIAEAARELVEKRQRWLNPTPPDPGGSPSHPPGLRPSPHFPENKQPRSPIDLENGGIEGGLKKRTLTNLYNARPTWLDLAHQKLDRAVLDAYGWPHDLSDEEILERLLALNLARAEEA